MQGPIKVETKRNPHVSNNPIIIGQNFAYLTESGSQMVEDYK